MKRQLAAMVAALLVFSLMPVSAGAGPDEPPTTGFEDRDGASWTDHDEEVEFLMEVDRRSGRANVKVIGKTTRGRPLHLVSLGHPRPHSRKVSRKQPTILFVCSQHGNEPAGREACLQLLRDLAFTGDPELADQLAKMTILFVPSANPDGRASNTRGNANGTDINRDHLNLVTPEARAVAKIVRKYRPEAVVDLHEYGPSQPGVYDDEILYLWPRNLNVDHKVHDLAVKLAIDYIAAGAEAAGYTADEYGQQEAGGQNVNQTAGDHDEGIARNLMGLRHSMGILVETRVDMDPRNGPDEVASEAAVMLRRVDSHMVVALEALRFMREKGRRAASITRWAKWRKQREGKRQSAPVYFGGADNVEPTASEIVDPPPCGYRLSTAQADALKPVFTLLGIKSKRVGGDVFVPMGQRAEPLIPLLLDNRGPRSATSGEPLDKC